MPLAPEPTSPGGVPPAPRPVSEAYLVIIHTPEPALLSKRFLLEKSGRR